jgi:mercuric ion binding protein
MKKILQKTALTLVLILFAATAFAEPQTYKLQVDGLACPFCAFGIEKKLSEIEGVNQLDTDIKTGVILLTMKDGVLLDETAAKQAVDKAGFTLRGFEQVQTSTQAIVKE